MSKFATLFVEVAQPATPAAWQAFSAFITQKYGAAGWQTVGFEFPPNSNTVVVALQQPFTPMAPPALDVHPHP
jgi:hypothetical protein